MKMKLTGVDPTVHNPQGKQVTPVLLEELPTWIRVARRGRDFSTAAQEAGVAEATLRRAEAGTDLSLRTVQELAAWMNVYVVVGPNGRPPEELEEEDVPIELEDEAESVH
jgi:hypothetical protein